LYLNKILHLKDVIRIIAVNLLNHHMFLWVKESDFLFFEDNNILVVKFHINHLEEVYKEVFFHMIQIFSKILDLINHQLQEQWFVLDQDKNIPHLMKFIN